MNRESEEQPPFRRLTVKEGVANCLREAIFQGKLNPGDRIVEIKWAKELGVAQASVREALHELEKEGFVERRPNRGSFVTILSPETIRHIYTARAALEALAVELLIRRAQRSKSRICNASPTRRRPRRW